MRSGWSSEGRTYMRSREFLGSWLLIAVEATCFLVFSETKSRLLLRARDVSRETG